MCTCMHGPCTQSITHHPLPHHWKNETAISTHILPFQQQFLKNKLLKCIHRIVPQKDLDEHIKKHSSHFGTWPTAAVGFVGHYTSYSYWRPLLVSSWDQNAPSGCVHDMYSRWCRRTRIQKIRKVIRIRTNESIMQRNACPRTRSTQMLRTKLWLCVPLVG